MTPYADIDLGQHLLRQWLDGTKPLPEPMLINHFEVLQHSHLVYFTMLKWHRLMESFLKEDKNLAVLII